MDRAVTAALSRVILVAGAVLGAGTAAAGLPANAGYEESCLACHGADLKGVEGLGGALVGSPFVDSRSVAQLVEFLKVGRQSTDPASISGRPMPGFSWLPPADLAAIAAYIKNPAGH